MKRSGHGRDADAEAKRPNTGYGRTPPANGRLGASGSHSHGHSAAGAGHATPLNQANVKEILKLLEVVWPQQTRATKPACYLWYHLSLALTIVPPSVVDTKLKMEGMSPKMISNVLRTFWDAAVKQLHLVGDFPFDTPYRLQQFLRGKGCFQVFTAPKEAPPHGVPVLATANPDTDWAVRLDKKQLERWYYMRVACALWPSWKSDMEQYIYYKLVMLLACDSDYAVRHSIPQTRLEEKLPIIWSSRPRAVPANPLPPMKDRALTDLLSRHLPRCFKFHVGVNKAQHVLQLDPAALDRMYDGVANNRLARLQEPPNQAYVNASKFNWGDLSRLPLALRPNGGMPRVVPSIDTMLNDWDPEDDADTDANAGMAEGHDVPYPAAPAAGGSGSGRGGGSGGQGGGDATTLPPVRPEQYTPIENPAAWVEMDANGMLPVVLVSQAHSREWNSMMAHLHACCLGNTCMTSLQGFKDDEGRLALAALLIPDETIIAQSQEHPEGLTAPPTVYVFPLAGIAEVAPRAVDQLRRLLEMEKMLTVVHGARQWSRALASYHGFSLGNLVDLQVFHGWLGLLQQLRTTNPLQSEPEPPPADSAEREEHKRSLRPAELWQLVEQYRTQSALLQYWRAPGIGFSSRKWSAWPLDTDVLQQAAGFVTPLLELYCYIQVDYHKCSTIKALTRADTLLAHLQLERTPGLAPGQPQYEVLHSTPPTTAAFISAADSFAKPSVAGRPPYVCLDLNFNERHEAMVTLGRAHDAALRARGLTAIPMGTPVPLPVEYHGAAALPPGTSAQPAQPPPTITIKPDPEDNPAPAGRTAAAAAAAPAPAAASMVIDLLDSDDEDAAAGGGVAAAANGSAAAANGAAANKAAAGNGTAAAAANGSAAAAAGAANGAEANGVVEVLEEEDTKPVFPMEEADADVESMLRLLPDRVVAAIPAAYRQRSSRIGIVEVVVDHKRPVQIKLSGGTPTETLAVALEMPEALNHLWRLYLAEHSELEGQENCTYMQKIAHMFPKDNRLTFDSCLHRISAMRDVRGGVAGLTFRVGRHIQGAARVFTDVMHTLTRNHDETMSGAAQWHVGANVPVKNVTSLLIVGRPGSGKTTMLRDIAWMLSRTFRRDTVVIDTSNEIAGDGTCPHPCIGDARRVSVTNRDEQHNLMLEVVQNHSPQVLMLDELGREQDVKAAVEISKRGVMMVATAHAAGLVGLVQNEELNPLLGGLQTVTLGDEMAKHKNRGVKTFRERENVPPFGVVIEMLGKNRFRVHPDAAASVDAHLRGQMPPSHIRNIEADGRMTVELDCPAAIKMFVPPVAVPPPMKPSLATQVHRLRDSSWLLELLRVNYLAKLQESGQVEEEAVNGPGGTFRIGEVLHQHPGGVSGSAAGGAAGAGRR